MYDYPLRFIKWDHSVQILTVLVMRVKVFISEEPPNFSSALGIPKIWTTLLRQLTLSIFSSWFLFWSCCSQPLLRAGHPYRDPLPNPAQQVN